jgi:hypothetical protein
MHLRWYAHFSRQFWAGDLYPRWLMDLNEGFGSPAFFFYPPVPYWISSLLFPISANATGFFYQLGVAAALGLVLSGYFAYLWLGTLVTTPWAVVGAIAYMAMPYHLAIDLWTRGAYAEFWAFVWMPLILYYTTHLLTGSTNAFIGVAVSYALLIMTHPPTTLTFSLMPLTSVILERRQVRARSLARVVGAMACGIGLSSIYLLPALLTQDSVSMEVLWRGHTYYANGFFFPHWTLKFARDVLALRVPRLSTFELELFWIVLSMVGLVVCANISLFQIRTHESISTRSIFWSLWAAFCLFMMFPLSDLVWRIIPPLQLIQFPWRFNSPLCVATAALLVLTLDRLSNPWTRKSTMIAGAVGLLVLSWIPVVKGSFQKYFSGPRWSSEAAAVSWLRSADASEYMPSTASTRLANLHKRFTFGTKAGSELKALVLEGKGSARVESWEPRHIRFLTSSENDLRVIVRQFNYTGWKPVGSYSTKNVVVGRSTEGLVEVLVPPGEHAVEIALKPSVMERLGLGLSAATWTLLACLVAFRFRVGKGA